MSAQPVRAEIVWEGQDELARYLGRTLPRAFSQSLTIAVLKTAEDAKERAKTIVPVDTGALKLSIRVERFSRPAGDVYYTGIRAGGYVRNPKTGRLVDYASYVEYGTSRMYPRPYIRPALKWALQKRMPLHFWSQMSQRVESR